MAIALQNHAILTYIDHAITRDHLIRDHKSPASRMACWGPRPSTSLAGGNASHAAPPALYRASQRLGRSREGLTASPAEQASAPTTSLATNKPLPASGVELQPDTGLGIPPTFSDNSDGASKSAPATLRGPADIERSGSNCPADAAGCHVETTNSVRDHPAMA